MDCLVCLEPLYDPKILHCGHTICGSCVWPLTQLLLTRGHLSTTIRCPVCRTETTVKDGNLNTNYSLKTLLETTDKALTSDKNCWKCDDNCTPKSCWLSPAVIVLTNMGEEKRTEALKFGREAIQSFKTAKEIADSIKSHFEEKFDHTWICQVNGKEAEQCSFSAEDTDTTYIYITISCVHILLYQVGQNEPCWKCGDIMCDMNSCLLLPCELQCDMEKNLALEIIEHASKELRNADSIISLTGEIQSYLEQEKGGLWYCAIGKPDESSWSFSCHKTPKSHIHFDLGKVRILVFQAALDWPCWKCGKAKCDLTSCEFDEPEVIQEASISEEVKKDALETAKELLSTESQPGAIAEKLKGKFEDTHGGAWQCLVSGGLIDSTGFSLSHDGSSIYFKISQVNIILFKALRDSYCWKCGLSKCEGKCNFDKSSVTVLNNLMSEAMANEAKRCGIEVMNRNTDMTAVCQEMQKSFDKKYGRTWNCFVRNGQLEDNWGYSVSSLNAHYIALQIGRASICLFKAATNEPSNCWKCATQECDKRSCNFQETKVYASFMSEKMTEEAVEVGTEAVRTKDDGNEIAMYIIDHFNQKYGPWWHCKAETAADSNGGMYVEEMKKCYVIFQVGQIFIVLYKGAQALSWKQQKKRDKIRRFLLGNWSPANSDFHTYRL